MTENLKKVIDGLTENNWAHMLENGIHIFKKHNLKVEFFWHSGEKKIWEIHIHEGESNKPIIETIGNEDLSYPLTLNNGYFIQ